MFCLSFINTSRPSVFPSHFSLICRLKKNEWNPQNPPILCNMECSIQKLSACGGGKPSSSFYKYMRMIVFLSSPTRKCTWHLKTDRTPETAILGIVCLRGSALNMYHLFPYGNHGRKCGFFRCGEAAGPSAFHFSCGHPFRRKTGLYHIHHDVNLSKWGNLQIQPDNFAAFKSRTSLSKWVGSGSLWVDPGSGKGWVQ